MTDDKGREATRGAGAWQHPAVYSNATVADPTTTRMRAAVLGWQVSLSYLGFPAPKNCHYDANTMHAAASFQAWAPDALGVDGQIGPHTGKAIVVRLCDPIALSHGVPNEYLRGLAHQESGYDVGAQGESNPRDYGVVQINLDAHPTITVTMSCNPLFALNWAAALMLERFMAFKTIANDVQRGWECAILAHNNPVAADAYAHGTPPTEKQLAYITAVLSGG